MKFIDMKMNQGEAHSRRITRRAVRGEYTSRRSSQAIQTLRPASKGFTSQRTPASAPIINTIGQPGGIGQNQRPPSNIMRSM